MVVAVIVVVVLSGKVSAAAKLGNALSKMMGETITKLVPNVLKQLAQNGSKLPYRMQRITSGPAMRVAQDANSANECP